MNASSNAQKQETTSQEEVPFAPRQRRRGLGARAHAAARLVVSGLNDQQVATAVGCHRVTVNKWRNQDAHFRAEVNRLLDGQEQAQVLRIENMRCEALRVIGDAIGGGDANIALRFLQATGPLGRPTIGPQTPAEVRHKDAYRELVGTLSEALTTDKGGVIAPLLEELKEASRRAEVGWELPLGEAVNASLEYTMMEVEGTAEQTERVGKLRGVFEAVQQTFERSDGEGLRGLATAQSSTQEEWFRLARLCLDLADPRTWEDELPESEECETLVRGAVGNLLEAAEHWLAALAGAGEGAGRTNLPDAPAVGRNLETVGDQLQQLRAAWEQATPESPADIDEGLAALQLVVLIMIKCAQLSLPDHEEAEGREE